jgi:hypothetical protein
MATLVTKPMSEAEAYMAEGAREISERLRALMRQHRRARQKRAADLVLAAAGNPLTAAIAIVAGAVLAGLLASRLIDRER